MLAKEADPDGKRTIGAFGFFPPSLPLLQAE